jgi:predicted site-specific integrase-resolvase
MARQHDNETLISAQTAARLANVSLVTIYQWAKAGKIAAFRDNQIGRYFITLKSLRSHLSPYRSEVSYEEARRIMSGTGPPLSEPAG